MRIVSISLLLLLATAVSVMAEGGLVAVGSNPYGALLNAPLIVKNKQLQKAAGIGTVSPKALAANFTYNGFAIRAALDADPPTAPCFTRVHLAFITGGQVNADTVLQLTPLYTINERSVSTFGPQQISVALNGRDVPVTVAGSYTEEKGGRQLALSIATALQGSCTFGAKDHLVRLIGENTLQPGQIFPAMLSGISGKGSKGGDTLLVDVGDGTFTQSVRAFYGYPVNVNNAWYTVALNADGSGFTAAPFTGKLGTIGMNRDQWDAVFIGSKYLLHLCGSAGQFSVPADQYRIYLLPPSSSCNAEGLPALLNATDINGNGRQYAVAAGQNETIIPASNTSRVQVNAMGPNITFMLAGLNGLGSGDIPFTVYDACGNTLFSSTFEHG